jgi:hypothetical protein
MLVGVFSTTAASRNRKRPCPEGPRTGSMFCACPVFSPVFFFLVVVTWLPDVTKGHLTLFGVPLDVRMRNRKLRNTNSDRRSRDSFGSVLGVFSTTSASYDHRKLTTRVLYLAWLPELATTHVLYLAWWLELALVICPFSYSVYIGCVVLLLCKEYIWKFPSAKMFFSFLFLHF